eukprot:scaffold86042_cov42-Phaeocystis_antarctica.AAC.1
MRTWSPRAARDFGGGLGLLTACRGDHSWGRGKLTLVLVAAVAVVALVAVVVVGHLAERFRSGEAASKSDDGGGQSVILRCGARRNWTRRRRRTRRRGRR